MAPMFGSLLNGGELHLFESRGRLHQLREWLASSRITVSTMSASMLRAACDETCSAAALGNLRLISTGGEELLRRDIERFRATFPFGNGVAERHGCNRNANLCAVFHSANRRD